MKWDKNRVLWHTKSTKIGEEECQWSKTKQLKYSDNYMKSNPNTSWKYSYMTLKRSSQLPCCFSLTGHQEKIPNRVKMNIKGKNQRELK